MLNKPALLLCAAALAPSLAGAALLQDLFNGDCLSGPGGASACAWTEEFDDSDTPVDYSLIDVSFDLYNGALGLVPAVSYMFDPALSVGDAEQIWFAFNYTLTTPAPITAVALELTGASATGDGAIVATDDYFSNNLIVDSLTAEINPDFGIDDNPVTTVLGAGYTTLFVEKEIKLDSLSSGTASLGDLHQSYDYTVPLPGTLALLAGGLAGIAAVRRRRVRTGAPD
jgi:hypothetical protein